MQAVKPKSGAKKGELKDFKINGPQMKILKTVAKLERLQIETTKATVQSMSGNLKSESGFTKNLSILRKQGLLGRGNAIIELTKQGRQLDGVVDSSQMSQNEFWTEIKQVLLPPAAGKIFDALIDGQVHEKKTIITKLGYQPDKLTGFNKYLSKMSSLGYLAKTKSHLQLTDKAFPLGRPGNGTMQI